MNDPEIQTETHNEIHEPQRLRRDPMRWFWLFVKVALVLGTLFLVGMVMLANMGGNSEALKKSLEDYIGENTRHKASIEKFNGMTFFPNISVDFEGLLLRPPGTASAVVYVRNARVVISFWDAMLGTGKIKFFDMRGIESAGGGFLDVPVKIERAGIVDTDGGARFEITGNLNAKPLNVFMTMDEQGIGKNKTFAFGSARDFEMVVGDIKISTQLRNVAENMTADNIDVTFQDRKLVSGTLNVEASSGKAAVGGKLVMAEHGSDLSPEIEIFLPRNGNPAEVIGVVKSLNFHLEDFAPGSAYDALVQALFHYTGLSEETPVHKVKLSIQDVYKSGAAQGPYEGPLPLKGWRIDTGAIEAKP